MWVISIWRNSLEKLCCVFLFGVWVSMGLPFMCHLCVFPGRSACVGLFVSYYVCVCLFVRVFSPVYVSICACLNVCLFFIYIVCVCLFVWIVCFSISLYFVCLDVPYNYLPIALSVLVCLYIFCQVWVSACVYIFFQSVSLCISIFLLLCPSAFPSLYII